MSNDIKALFENIIENGVEKLKSIEICNTAIDKNNEILKSINEKLSICTDKDLKVLLNNQIDIINEFNEVAKMQINLCKDNSISTHELDRKLVLNEEKFKTLALQFRINSENFMNFK